MSVLNPKRQPSHRSRAFATTAACMLALCGAAAATITVGQPERIRQERRVVDRERLERQAQREIEMKAREAVRREAQDRRRAELERRSQDIAAAPFLDEPRISAMLAEMAVLLEPIHAEEKRIEELEAKLEPFEERVEVLEEMIGEHEEMMEPIEEEIAAFEAEIGDREDRFEELEDRRDQRLDEAEEELEELARDLRQTERELRRVERSDPDNPALADLEARREGIERAIDEIQQAIEQAVHDADRELMGVRHDKERAVRRMHEKIRKQHAGLEEVHAEIQKVHEKIQLEHEAMHEVHEQMHESHQRITELHAALEPIHAKLGEALGEIRRDALLGAIEQAGLGGHRELITVISSADSLDGVGTFPQMNEEHYAVLVEPEWSMPPVMEAVREAERSGQLALSDSDRVNLYAALASWAESVRILKFESQG